MRFDRIKLSNFRQYQNLELDFDGGYEHDLHIITAKNGIGKTTLLNAINWCLYGDEPHLGGNSSSLPVLNTKAIKQAIDANQDSAIVSVEITASTTDRSFVFRRERTVHVSYSGKITKEYEKNSATEMPKGEGEPTVHLSKDADACIDKYLPKRIRQYFFFDGEQLDNYFRASSSDRVKQSIHAISQVDLVTSVKKHLEAMIGKKEKEAGKRQPNIKKLSDELEFRKANVAEREGQIEECRRIIRKNQERVEWLNEQLDGFEDAPEINAQWNRLVKNRESEEAMRIEAYRDLMRYIRDIRVAFSFYPAAVQTLQYIKEKREAKQLPANIDIGVLKKTLADGRCEVCGQELGDEAAANIERMLSEYSISNATSVTLIGIESELKNLVSAVKRYPEQKKKLLKAVRQHEQNISEIEAQFKVVDERMKQLGNADMVPAYHKERKVLNEEIDSKKARIGALLAGLKGAQSLRDEAQKKLNKALQKESKTKEISDDIEFLRRAYDVVAKVEKEMMADVRHTMETATSDYFDEFIWKKNVYEKVTLDRNYQVDVIHKDGYPCLDTCSAGERALLALAFTLAMHQVSGFNAPLFIDTPLARISDDNRTNFANVLSGVSKEKEIIMTLTPSEYSPEIHDVFDDILASNRAFETEDEETTILKDGE